MSNNMLTMREYVETKKKIAAVAADLRGSTITAFSVKEVAAFTGLAESTVYTYLAKGRSSSMKIRMSDGRMRRMVTPDVFVKMSRQIGTHRVLGLNVISDSKKLQKETYPVVDMLFNSLY